MSKITVLKNQTIFDVALQQSGSIESVFEMMKINSMSNLLVAPFSQIVPPGVLNQKVIDYYKIKSIVPASALKKRNKSFNKSFNSSFS